MIPLIYSYRQHLYIAYNSHYIVVHILQSMKYVEDQTYNHEMYPFPIPDFMTEKVDYNTLFLVLLLILFIIAFFVKFMLPMKSKVSQYYVVS